jgi:two-component system KDP operon response regulator KdpE
MSVPELATRVLAVDDEAGMRRALRAILATRGYDVRLAATGEEALHAASSAPHEIVILDLALPDVDGIEVCHRLREWTSVPILVLSARSGEQDKIAALDSGADDYLTKPFSAGELLARVRALLRRSAGQTQRAPLIRSGDLEVDLAGRAVRLSGEKVSLTPTEYDVLAFLVQNANCVVTRGQITQRVWGRAGTDETEALRVHVSHIRRKIETITAARRFILTEPGIGYRFLVPE